MVDLAAPKLGTGEVDSWEYGLSGAEASLHDEPKTNANNVN